MDPDKVSNNVQSKKRKIDWNGVIIKELRKVFKASHLKPMKIISPHGKEENAPWRVWFEVAYSRGIHTQLPDDILKKAMERYPVQAPNGQQQRQDVGEQVMFDTPPPNGFTGFLIEPLPLLSQPLLPQPGMPQQPKALNYLFTSSGPIPPPSSDRRFDLLQPHPAPPHLYGTDSPIDHRMSYLMVNSGEHPTLHSSTPVASSDPSLFIPSPETFTAPTPPQPALQGGYPPQLPPVDHPEGPSTPQLDEAINYLITRKDNDIKLPPLDAIPPEQKTSNPALPTFPVAPVSPPVRSRYAAGSWPSDASSAFGSSDVEYSSDHASSQGVPPIAVTHVHPSLLSASVPKEEPMEDEAAFAKAKIDMYSTTPFMGHHSNGTHSNEHHFKFSKLKAEKVEADTVHAGVISAKQFVTLESTNYSDVRLKEEFETFSDGMQVVRDLEPVSFRWKENAQDIINSQTRLPPASLPPSLHPKDSSSSVKSITIANTKANTNIPSGEHEPQVSPSKENAPHVNFSLDTREHTSRSSTPSSHAPPSSFVRTSSVPASLHAPPVAPPIATRTYSERYLYAHLPDRRYYNAYVYEDEKYNSDYEVSDDSSDEESDKEDDGDMGDDEHETQEQKPKTIGFAAQNVQQAHPNLVKEDPKTGILSIDPVGLLASVVGAVKDLDIRTTKLESSHTLVTPASYLSPVCSPIPISPPPSPIPAPVTHGVISLCSLEKGYLVINPKALDFLRVQPNVSILTLCGPKKTGKSLFCNMFLPRECTEKFNMSSAVDGPKGLWVYNAPISDKRGEKNYLVVDSTGIDYSDVNVDKLVTLIWLISSVLVFKDYRTLDIQKFDIFRSVRKIGQRITEEHERPALACLIDDDLKITDPDKYMSTLVNDKKHPEICEAVRKCFEFRTVLQIAAPKVYEMESKNFHSGAFYTSFENVKDKLESYLLNFTLGSKDAAGHEFAKYFLQSVHILNNP